MVDFPLLSLMTFLPLAGVIMILMIRGSEEVVVQNTKYMALYTFLVYAGFCAVYVYAL